MLEVQKLAWFVVGVIQRPGLLDAMSLHFEANEYGP